MSSAEAVLSQINKCEGDLLKFLDSNPTTKRWNLWFGDVKRFRAACVGEEAPLAVLADELLLLGALVAPASSLPTSLGETQLPPVSARRFGYAVMLGPSAERVFLPTFALVLQSRKRPALPANMPMDLQSELPELSLADLALWNMLKAVTAESIPNLLRTWLTSPARRFAWEFGALDRVSSTSVSLSPQRIKLAVGDSVTARPDTGDSHWPVLHSANPWPKIPPEEISDRDLIRVLRALDAPVRFWDQSRALESLLVRLERKPEFRAGELRRSLSEVLPLRFEAMISDPADVHLIALERELLRLAVVFFPDEHNSPFLFSVARWLGYVLRRSPLHRGDVAVLAARLHQVSQGFERLIPEPEDDALHPRRLLLMLSDEIAWREYGIVVGAAAFVLHHHQKDKTVSIPSPLERKLQRIAGRSLSEREREQESSFTKRDDKTPCPYEFVSPPWAARVVLNKVGSLWFAQMEEGAARELLEETLKDPERFVWVLDDVATASPWLGKELRTVCAEAWRKTKENLLDIYRIAQLGIAGLTELSEEERRTLAQQCLVVDAKWRPYLIESAAEVARKTGHSDIEAQFILTQAEAAEDKNAPTEMRRRSIAFWLRRLFLRADLRTPAMMERLRELAFESVVQKEKALMREMERFGVVTKTNEGGAR